MEDSFRNEIGATRIVDPVVQSISQTQIPEQSTTAVVDHADTTINKEDTVKKFTRNRLSHDQRRNISERCFEYYLQGWSTL